MSMTFRACRRAWRDARGLAALCAALGGVGRGALRRRRGARHAARDCRSPTSTSPRAIAPEDGDRSCSRRPGSRRCRPASRTARSPRCSPDGPVEVTTLRRDVSTDGRHATVAFTDDWREDAARRDFTINALYADPATGEIFDYFGGLDDLAARRVRFIGDPLPAHRRGSSAHPALLPLPRALRRAAPDAAGLAACAARANDLMALSRERIADELLQAAGRAAIAVARRRADDRRTASCAPVLPEIDADGVARAARAGRGAKRAAGDRARRDPPPRRAAAARCRGRRAGRRAAASCPTRQRKRLACAAIAAPSGASRTRSPIALGTQSARSIACCSAGGPTRAAMRCATGRRRACRSAAALWSRAG